MLVGGTYRFRSGVDQRVGIKRMEAVPISARVLAWVDSVS
jgi:hypothetical protein